ncbi:MAG: hypothetical protein PF569_09080 [Candidatus Woesearchaeota archaeon]|jgi:hypothetical protein|nr:hypothetical protein [Candidatus Woesearchaeota archaeon]
MRVISFDDVKNGFDKNEDYLRIDITGENVAKVSFLILYYKEHGFKNFLLNYNFEFIDLNFKKLFTKLKIANILRLVEEYGFKVSFCGLPSCIFERSILRPQDRWKFEDKIRFMPTCDFCETETMKGDHCGDCMSGSLCKGFSKNYFENYGCDDFEPLTKNIDLETLHIEEIAKFKSEAVKFYAEKVLEDYIKDHFFMRKRFVFLNSYPRDDPTNFSDKFVYHIFNRKDDFEETYDFLQGFFDKDFLKSIREYMFGSSQITISLGMSNDDVLKKTIYLSLDGIDEEQREQFLKFFDIKVQGNNVWCVGFDFRADLVGYKVSYKEDSVSSIDLKRFVQEIGLESKKNLMRFSNSLIKPLNNVLYDYKYRHGEHISKRINVSLESNNFRLNQLALLFKIPMAFYDDKELLNLSFEMSEGEIETINLYYSLKLPEEEERDYIFN